jgi:PTH2 family peptidyl-tRNA hydrolase
MYKQTIVIRADLGMGRGKIAAQASHASLEAYKKAMREDSDSTRMWEETGMKKVVLKVNGESELLEYYNRGKDADIPVALIRDAGHTQLVPGTISAFAAGPFDENELERIYGNLKLL